MAQGTVVRLVPEKMFGFIKEVGSTDFKLTFFHANDLSPEIPFDGTLIERRVRFRPEANERGPRARDVRAAD